MNYYRKIRFDGKIYVSNDLDFEDNIMKKKFGKIKFDWFIELNGKGRGIICRSKKIPLAKIHYLGAFKDKECTKKQRI